ncbi:hypothetical protein POJ06DRAFT_269677 [Lipomyces tetrasporus]|uniref:Uncharacterized protein n=1 Tax=Lipomyces tetrasporus TaxID=54092 RepID=A0AAD7QNN5_9ASCO|nr:uncharacterized protein POJ06DRAFT_269677 [Lipomyces tetrasporus]KAJ8098581.1 hypothetical protein POJ06DRAFT_269677 [Lipomyces tetrasporus]
MDAVYGDVAPIATRSVKDQAESSKRNETKPVGNATGATVKRKAVDESIDDNTVPGSHSVSDQAEEQSKRVKLDNETEAPALAEITKPMTATDSEVLSNCNKAFMLLKEIQLPLKCISEDQRYPSLRYNSLTLSIVTCPSNIRERAARWIERKIINCVEDYLSTSSPHTLRHIRQYEAATTHSPYGQYTEQKEADGGFNYAPADVPDKAVVVVEVRYSEAHRYLLDGKDIWNQGS